MEQGNLFIKDDSRKFTLPDKYSFKFTIEGKDILVLQDDGDIYVNGNLIENDKQVVDGLREFLKLTKKENTSIKDYSMESLIQELQRRTSVTSVDVRAFECKSVGALEVDGPATILIVKE
jgi:hypothetical protein